ncbi:MAG TPA: CDP-alcohol phosphatidyltransferase family protein, partial [Pseudomonadales bacterium]|nr:CDP-alcohol phosphatidyltransferase family protein [Pseudomonadales bacterium]
LLRIGLVLPFVLFLLKEEYQQAVLLLAVAGASDGLDGFLARRFGWQSRVGALLDPVADKLLLVSTYVCLAYLGHFPVWVMVIVVARDLIIFAGAVAYWFLISPYNGQPSILGKACTFTQVFFALLNLFNLAIRPVSEWALWVGDWIVVLLSLLSGAQYVWIWGERALRSYRHDDPERRG